MWKRLTSLLLVTGTLALAGCGGGANIKRAEQLQVGLPEQTAQKVIAPEAQQAYAQAVDLLRAGKSYEARTILEKIVRQWPDVAGAWLNLALLDYQEGFLDSARARVDKALALSPRNAAAYTLSGTLYRQAGEFRKAWEAYALALAADDNYALAHLNLAILFDIYLQYWLDAKTHYERYLALAGKDEQVQLWLQDLERRIRQAGGQS